MKNHFDKKTMRKRNLILLLTMAACLSGCTNSKSAQKSNIQTTIQEQTTTKTPAAAPAPTTTQTPTTTEVTTTQAPTTTQPPTTQEPTTVPEHRTGANIIGISDKDIFDIGGPRTFARNKVRNDVTGKWRISTIAENIDIKDYALSYYKKYFYSDSEVHAIVNFNYNTTTCITYLSGILYVDTYKYVKGEEHDANILFTGTHLSEVLVYTDNGDIEKVFN